MQNISNINILVSLETDAIQKLLNENLPDPLIKDLQPPGSGGITINARKNGDVNFSAEGNTFDYQIPLQLSVFKSTTFKNIDVAFEILIGLKTQYLIKDNWKLVTRTELAGYTWIKKPKLNLGFLNIPLDATVIDLIYKNKETLCKQIDDQVMKLADVRPILSNVLSSLPNPVVLLETEKIYWHCDIIKTKLSPFSTDEGWSYVAMALEAPVYFSYGKSLDKVTTVIKAPDLVQEVDKESTFQTSCAIDFPTLEKFATTFLQQKEFDVKGQKIKINNVQIKGVNDKLKITIKTDGSFQGTVIVAAQPTFNSSTQQIELKNHELDLKGDNFKSKAIALVATNAIESKMSDFLNFPIKNGIDILNKQIASTPIPPNFVIRAKIKSVDIPTINVQADGLQLGILAKGLLLFKLGMEKPLA